ncbi:MAG TPA: VOC family protein [Acidimicrobiales bacterium]|nr:VOC family protein [Acidimicrobiales bacterium]
MGSGGSEAGRPAVTAGFGHIGLCVSDLDRSRRFYVEGLGFELVNGIDVPDSPADRLLRLEPPLGLRAEYLAKDGFVLELMHFDREANPPGTERVMNEPGLTHLSFSVDDVSAAAGRLETLGAQVMRDTDVGGGIFLRDPDGQLIELYPAGYRRFLYGGR